MPRSITGEISVSGVLPKSSTGEFDVTDNPIIRCPYCMAPMEEKPLDRKLTYRQTPIYKAIVEAGTCL